MGQDIMGKTDISELLAKGQSVQFSAKGYSMYPLINPDKGDQVIVQPLGGKILRRGDVVLYRRDGEKGWMDDKGFEQGILVLHRIIKRRGNDFFLVGDNQNQVEGPIREEQVIGIMVARVRKGKALYVKNLLYSMSTGLWLMMCPIRPKLMRIAEVLKNLLLGRKPPKR